MYVILTRVTVKQEHEQGGASFKCFLLIVNPLVQNKRLNHILQWFKTA